MRTPNRLLAALGIVAFLFSSRAGAGDIVIIANADVAIDGPVSRAQLAAIYLLRLTTWPDGTPIVPVNREVTAPIRAAFSAIILTEDNHTLSLYWNEMHYRGKFPPVVQESEAAMLAFVQNVPGAVGYIDSSTAPDKVRVLARFSTSAPEERP